jgi:O-antigen ligase
MSLRITSWPRRSVWATRLLFGGVVLALLGLSLAAGLLAGAGRNLLALLLIVAPAGFLAIMAASRWFVLFVLALPIAALAVPFSVPTGTETRLPAALLLSIGLCGFWICSMTIRSQYKLAPSPLNKPILVFNTLCCISLLWGIVWRDPGLIDAPKFIFTQTASLVTILVSTGAALLIGNFVQRPAHLQYFAVAFIVAGCAMTITQLLHINQHFLDDGGLWGMWTVAPAFGLLIAQPRLRWRWRAALILVIAATIYLAMIVNADWLSGWVPIIAAVAAATFLRSRKAFVVLVVVGVIAAYGMRGWFTQIADDNVDDGSLERLSLWDQNWRVVRAHWLLGTGPAGYAIYYMTYYRDDARSTHNNYLDIVSQFGFSGMAVWLWLAIGGVVEGWRLVGRAPPGSLKTLALIATAGWVGAQVSMFFGDWVLPFAYNQGVGGYKYTVYTWLFFGMLISLRQLIDKPPPTHVAD